MKKKNETDALNETITLLENKRAEELKLLKEQLHVVQDNLKPINLLKSTFHEITSSPEIKNNIVSNTIGITTGYLTKKVLFGASHNPIKKLFGTLLQFAIANIVSKHSDGIKSAGENLLHRFLKHRKEAKKEFHKNGNDLFI
jgi:hypothetical protein